jgi:hypothetical protein
MRIGLSLFMYFESKLQQQDWTKYSFTPRTFLRRLYMNVLGFGKYSTLSIINLSQETWQGDLQATSSFTATQ